MLYTPTGKSAFTNPKSDHKPKKEHGELVKGFLNTYKRQNWDTPGYTVTMDNVKISSQNNVHPGRLIGKDANGNDIYSDPRTLTLYEIMRIMSIPENWPIPENASEAFLRRVIGEGVPPLMVKRFFEQLIVKNEK
jgi:DNA (cytosine-5)-methyltransferase 1